MLGFTEVTWDNWSGSEPQPASVKKSWAELTDDERAAATYLGFSENSWDTRAPLAATKVWASLATMEKIAATKLGFTETTWDNESGEEVQPPSSKKSWWEMNEQELAALIVLGYRQMNWDNWPSEQPASFSKLWNKLTSCGK